MLVVVFVLCLVRVNSVEASAYDLKCSDYEHANATMRTILENFDDGRYMIQVCVKMKPNVTKWVLDLIYRDPNRSCSKPSPGKISGKPGTTHTTITADSIADRLESLNCTNVCLTTETMFIFRSCYLLKSVLHTKRSEYAPYDSYFNITNNYTLDYFNKTPNVSIINHENDIAISFFINVQPDTYDVKLVNVNKSKNVDDVTGNCTSHSVPPSVECTVVGEAGCFEMWLDNNSPWAGAFSAQRHLRKDWCRAEPPGAGGAGGHGSDWTAAWSCAVLALLLAAAALACRYRDTRHLHKRVLRYWTQYSSRSASTERAAEAVEAVEAEAEAGAGVVRVLLLYARECDRGQRLVAALRELLLQYPHVQVDEVFSAECMRAGGAAPHAWLQHALRVRRVLVLQTPALAALYTPRQRHLDTSEPLLGHGAVYRSPHFGDTLLQYALRLLTDDACHPLAYRKYYLATLSALPTELFPVIVPFRRYSLPDAAAVLVRDVCGIEPAPHTDESLTSALLNLQHAAEEFVTYVQDNPDYIMDELLIT